MNSAFQSSNDRRKARLGTRARGSRAILERRKAPLPGAFQLSRQVRRRGLGSLRGAGEIAAGPESRSRQIPPEGNPMELESPGIPSPQCRFALAVDPGVHGALATYEWVDDDAAWKVDKLAGSPQELFWQCSKHKVTAEGLSASPVAVIEDVGGFIGIPQPGSRMFTFGRSYGQLEGILVALGLDSQD